MSLRSLRRLRVCAANVLCPALHFPLHMLGAFVHAAGWGMGNEAAAFFGYFQSGSRRHGAVYDCEFRFELFNVADCYVCKVLLVAAGQANVQGVYLAWNVFSA